jgi:hypothetical protein
VGWTSTEPVIATGDLNLGPSWGTYRCASSLWTDLSAAERELCRWETHDGILR